MTKNGISLDQCTFKRLSRLYILALSPFTLSVIISQILIRKHLNDQDRDSTIINVAGRQRMLSQKLTKEIVSISIENDLEKRIALKNELKETLALWELSHNGLQIGNDSLGLPGTNSAAVSKMFSELNPKFNTIRDAAKSIIEKTENIPPLPIDMLTEEINTVKQTESDFLTIMDDIVNQYDFEADGKVTWLRKLELFIMVITLALLLAEFLFIFWPTAKTVKQSLAELIEAEKKAKKMAYDADLLSVAKEKSIKELRALTHAMDETLLFARIMPNGTIVHMGNKFSKLFKFNNFNGNANFYEVLSIMESERAFIESLIVKNKKTGWQGEVKATTKEHLSVWLEMAIIPFNPTDDKSELLIIASEITKRKEGQIEIERLTKESFEDRMNQQKVISSKIIENQEKEQNRI